MDGKFEEISLILEAILLKSVLRKRRPNPGFSAGIRDPYSIL